MILKVQSQTNPNTYYDVTINDATGVATGCSCPSARWRSVSCKHVDGVNHDQDQVRFLACRGRRQVLGNANLALMEAIYTVVRQGPTHRPTGAQIAGLARIVDNITEDPWGDVERRVLGGLLTALTANDAHVLTAA